MQLNVAVRHEATAETLLYKKNSRQSFYSEISSEEVERERGEGEGGSLHGVQDATDGRKDGVEEAGDGRDDAVEA